MISGLTGAIIAAGRGERLREASGDLPKPLVEIDGQTLLSRQARCMLDAGVRRVLAIVNCETAAMMHARSLRMPGELEIMVRDTPNSMESLLALGEQLPRGRFVLATVDAVIERHEFVRFVERAAELTDPFGNGGAEGALGIVRWRGDRRPLFAQMAPDGLIRRLGEPETALVTAGVYLLPTRIFEYVARARAEKLDALRRFLGMLVDDGMRFAGIELVQAIDVDEAADLQAARKFLVQPPSEVHTQARVHRVRPEDGSKP